MSMSSNSSSSTSVPVVTETPENSIIDQISGVASGLANQMLNWASGVFAQTSAITNQTVGNFFQVSQNMLGLSGNLTNQYNNLFAPENAQLVADANSYNSTARQQVDMGQAGATQAQAGAAGLANSEEALRSYGIDPSSGRYAALDKAAAVQNAANVAGAENTQRNADVATGQRLRSEAVQVGAQLPAAIANVNNTAIQANAGASNATLANANTGANLMKLPNDYLNTAMNVKLPLQGQNSQSHSTGSSSSPEKPSSGGGGNGGGSGSGGGGSGSGGPAWMPTHGGGGGNGGSGAVGRGNPSAEILHLPPGPDPGNIGEPPIGPTDPGNTDQSGGLGGNGPGAWPGDYGSGTDSGAGAFGNSFGQDWANGNTADPGIFGGPNTGGYTGDFNPGGNTGGGGADMSGLGAYDYNPSSNPAQLPGDWTDPSPQMSSDPGIWGNGGDQYSNPPPQQDYSNSNGGGYDTTSPSSDTYAGDYTAPSDTYDMGGSYARGGAISPAMSPSRGRQVDDIPAQGPGGRQLHMNANEFVIPQDVALWKGQEFFQNLIDQSRKKRVMAPAKPSPTAQAQPQQPMR